MVTLDKYNFLLFIGVTILICSGLKSADEWGFFAHKKINRLAVYTCPPGLISFYKKHIDYISDHAIDPDMRRHASKHEAVRHYIDIDHWGDFPFMNVPRQYPEAIVKFGKFVLYYSDGGIDTMTTTMVEDSLFLKGSNNDYTFLQDSFLQYFNDSLYQLRYNDLWIKEIKTDLFGNKVKSIEVIDDFSEYGILPFALLQIHYRLIDAFERHDLGDVLRLSADYGHYISDAHVPLHTTENYNGQMTGQDGIHAFWESRIPELFAEEKYDFFVGKAKYINNLNEYFWDIVLDSHAQVEMVLGEEKRLRSSFPSDRQFCYDERNGITVRIECPEFADAYSKSMGDMVEERFRSAILATGSLWYTAWVQAGKPELKLNEVDFSKTVNDTLKVNGKVLGRQHN